MSGKRSTIKGAASFRRMLKALPDSANTRLVAFLNNAGPVIATAMREKIPVLASPRPHRTAGAARDSITWKVTPKTLNLKVGELTKKSIVFYAHILDVGRKAQTVNVTRGSKAPYTMRVPGMAPLNIVRATRTAFRVDTLPGYRTLMDSILLDAAKGAGND
ncbi:hypothetical protein U1839_06095 [Sphingomonas sp. RT2P30]|uniref:hypothetical protein n=1 Tax=Parasphingomonas halimpatiens TaxID=3096162 RepID=UPI002FC8DC4E